jgi:AraC family transcriptional regulator of adaptative response/methylated-DNA-[protein]-cysteine methyltransferase
MMLAHTTPDPMPAPRTDDRRWTAVLARDRAADGQFVYAVTSTGVFCRPSCPSRRPRRHNVAFFAAPSEAERAGFRACLRCAPAGARPVSAAARAVADAAAYLRAHATDTVALAVLAARVGLSPSHLQRAFTAHTGVSPREFQAACRAEHFRTALRAGHDVTSATYEAGYGSPSRVSANKPTGAGLTPSAYRKGAPGAVITYAVVTSALGRLLVAATATGVCAVKLGEGDAALAAELTAEFPGATVRPGTLPGGWATAIATAIGARPATTPDVPLDVRGTAFQWRVWKALQAIPAGETRSYAQVAASIGRPTAVRAVARACATNPVALVVPCHRVVPSAGGTGGYRWGAARKAALLTRELIPGSDPLRKP